MLTQAEPQRMDLGANQEDSYEAEGLLQRKIWLPKLVYDCLPYFYLTAGFAAFFATLYISEWFWILPHYLLFRVAKESSIGAARTASISTKTEWQSKC